MRAAGEKPMNPQQQKARRDRIDVVEQTVLQLTSAHETLEAVVTRGLKREHDHCEGAFQTEAAAREEAIEELRRKTEEALTKIVTDLSGGSLWHRVRWFFTGRF